MPVAGTTQQADSHMDVTAAPAPLAWGTRPCHVVQTLFELIQAQGHAG